MHYSHILILASAGFGFASPSPSSASLLNRGATIPATMQLTNSIASIDLAEYENLQMRDTNVTSLEKRRVVDICLANNARAGVCVAVTGVVSTVALGIAALLKANSDNNDCTMHTGTADDVTWKVFATGSNCDTTAQLDTIRGAVTVYLDSQNDYICGVHCLKLSHGGTYVGYVTLAPAGTNLSTFYCGASNSFGSCVSGGTNDK